MSLWSEFSSNAFSRAAYKPTHYFHAYERHLERFRGLAVTMVEIGVRRGGSLQMWKRYLGPSAQIVGIDIDPKCKAFEGPQVAVRIGDQGDRAFMQSVVDEFGEIDIVLDDGSHRGADIAASFDVLYPRLERNGVYIVEDVGTAYLPEWVGADPAAPTFVDAVKQRIDELHAEEAPGLEPTSFTRTTASLHVYDNLVVFERGRRIARRHHAVAPDPMRAEGDVPVLKLARDE